MKSVGEIIHSKRIERRLSLSQVAEDLSIQEGYVKALEVNDFESLPSFVAAQGYIASVAAYLGLKPESMLALLRRDFAHIQDSSYPLAVISKERLKRRKVITSMVASALVILAVIGGGYGFWMYQRVRQAPLLTLFSPKEGERVESPVFVQGRTASDAVVEVDNQAISVSQDGEFVSQVELAPGDHVITVGSKNRYGKETMQQIMVTVESSQQ